MATSAEIRERLAAELRLDLIGPSHRDAVLVNEVLPDPPSRWYLTGFLVLVDTPPRRKARDPQEEMDTAEQGDADDDETPDRSASRPRYMPSSMGLSLLIEPGTEALRVTCRWGDYRREEADENGGRKTARWRREQREAACDVPLTQGPPIRFLDDRRSDFPDLVSGARIKVDRARRAMAAATPRPLERPQQHRPLPG
jgi:hypothetical protein